RKQPSRLAQIRRAEPAAQRRCARSFRGAEGRNACVVSVLFLARHVALPHRRRALKRRLRSDPSAMTKRFYKSASVTEDASGFGVALDARNLRTAAGAAFRVPTRTLAEGCAAEWAAQGELIAPKTMPLTQFAFAAIDHTPQRRGELAEH